MKDQPKVTDKARSEQMPKEQSLLQKKEEFREKLAAFLNFQDEAKRSVVPESVKLRWPEGEALIQEPGEITIGEVNSNYMMLKQEEKEEEKKEVKKKKKKKKKKQRKEQMKKENKNE